MLLKPQRMVGQETQLAMLNGVLQFRDYEYHLDDAAQHNETQTNRLLHQQKLWGSVIPVRLCEVLRQV